MRRLPPSCQLSAPSPCKKAAVSVWEIGLFALPMSTPRRRNPSRCGACIARGHPTAAPPIIVTKLRRLIGSLRRHRPVVAPCSVVSPRSHCEVFRSVRPLVSTIARDRISPQTVWAVAGPPSVIIEHRSFLRVRACASAMIAWPGESMKQPVERRLAAILAADVAGYSRLMGADEEGTHERLKAHLK